MSNFRTYPVTSDLGLMDERPVLIALVATLVAWLAVGAVVLA
jgi:hypothetical protein